jgi:hypothetical protein
MNTTGSSFQEKKEGYGEDGELEEDEGGTWMTS